MTFPTGLYRHYKGQHYRVLGCARHSETEELLVIYQALYGDAGVWVRPASMFSETVQVAGQMRPRFELLRTEPGLECLPPLALDA
ncbi:box-like protein [Lasius niger]|uniref:Box-like protein n=1 Tax=Lasius niger TaxID=67767 RepID=A0A0J7JVG8_LASNI|nr:box-like protein [Lasius niger]